MAIIPSETKAKIHPGIPLRDAGGVTSLRDAAAPRSAGKRKSWKASAGIVNSSGPFAGLFSTVRSAVAAI